MTADPKRARVVVATLDWLRNARTALTGPDGEVCLIIRGARQSYPVGACEGLKDAALAELDEQIAAYEAELEALGMGPGGQDGETP